jgi:enoyl-CoA hydratase/carnithine racemase
MVSSAASPLLQIARRGGLTSCLLNRPHALNVITLQMVRELRQLYASSAESNCRVLLLEGAGGKAFCAGGDVKAVALDALSGGTLARDFFAEEYALNALIAELPPTTTQVSVWDGVVMGGGVGLSVHGRFRLATERTVFAMPEAGIGFFPDVGASHFLNQLPGCAGTYLALTGARIGARDACRLGLATHYAQSDAVPQVREALADCASAAEVDARLRELSGGREEPPRLANSIEEHAETIARCFSEPTVARIVSALHADGGEWAAATSLAMRKHSPDSLVATLHLLRQNVGLPLRECLAREYALARAFTRAPSDFFEGVRAVLIDKDQAPRWLEPDVEQLQIERVLERSFAPPDAEVAAIANGLRVRAPRAQL